MDPQHIAQAIEIIFHNAVDNMPSGGILMIDVEKDETKVCLSIKDMGLGYELTEDQSAQLFHPLFEYRNKKVGLSLSIAKTIIESHRGTLTVENDQNTGTEFIIQLPYS